MKLEVPDKFVKVLKIIEREVQPLKVVDWLDWASKNPLEAERAAELYEKLSSQHGKHVFENCLYAGYGPLEAAESAVKHDVEFKEKRSLLSKVVADARKGGHKLVLPSNVQCTIIWDAEADAYWFRFNVAGEEIGILYHRRGLQYVLESWRSGWPTKFGIKGLSYKGKFYRPHTDTAEILFKAVEENMKPEILATLGSE